MVLSVLVSLSFLSLNTMSHLDNFIMNNHVIHFVHCNMCNIVYGTEQFLLTGFYCS